MKYKLSKVDKKTSMTQKDWSELSKILSDYDSDKTDKLVKDFKYLKLYGAQQETEYNTLDNAMLAVFIGLVLL